MSELQLSTIGHIMLGVRDLENSLEFYTETLGMKLVPKMEEMAFLEASNVTLVLSRSLADASDELVGATEVVFAVDDVSDAYRQLSKRRARFLNEPRQVTDEAGQRISSTRMATASQNSGQCISDQSSVTSDQRIGHQRSVLGLRAERKFLDTQRAQRHTEARLKRLCEPASSVSSVFNPQELDLASGPRPRWGLRAPRAGN